MFDKPTLPQDIQNEIKNPESAVADVKMQEPEIDAADLPGYTKNEREPRRQETREEFLQRGQREGLGLLESEGQIYAYVKTPEAAMSDTARIASSYLREHYGIQSVIFDGDMEVNQDGMTGKRAMQAGVFTDGTVYINNQTQMDPIEIAGHEKLHHIAKVQPEAGMTGKRAMQAGVFTDGTVYINNQTQMDPIEIAGHEKLHHIAKVQPEAVEAFYESAFDDNLDFMSEGLIDFVEQIGKAYIGHDFDIADPMHWTKIREEMAAYLSGHWASGDSRLYEEKEYFHNWSLVEDGYKRLDGTIREGLDSADSATYTESTKGQGGSQNGQNESSFGREFASVDDFGRRIETGRTLAGSDRGRPRLWKRICVSG